MALRTVSESLRSSNKPKTIAIFIKNRSLSSAIHSHLTSIVVKNADSCEGSRDDSGRASCSLFGVGNGGGGGGVEDDEKYDENGGGDDACGGTDAGDTIGVMVDT